MREPGKNNFADLALFTVCSRGESDAVEDLAVFPVSVLDNKELMDAGRTDATAPLMVGNAVFDVLAFDPHHIIKFTRKQYQFLNSYRLGVSLKEAAQKADMSAETADHFLKRPDTVKWLEDRALMHHIKTEWQESARWWKMGDDVLEGKKALSKAQTVVFQEFGARICPKPREGDGRNPQSQTVNFNFSKEAVEAAFQRQQAIDAEVRVP
jgi:hypothetical protein